MLWGQVTGHGRSRAAECRANYDGFVLTGSVKIHYRPAIGDISPMQVMSIPFWEERLLGNKGMCGVPSSAVVR